MSNPKPDRSAKLKLRLRASETARVAAVREVETVRKNAGAFMTTIRDLKAQIKKAWRENGRLQDELDGMKREAGE